jgi:nucleotide-binding universal stress UspA family protein
MIAIRRILCPIDFSETADRAAAEASRMARWYRADVHALHVLPLMTEAWAAGFPVDPHTHEPRVPVDLRAHLEGRLQDARASGVIVEAHLREGGAAAEILRYADESAADLIVMGTHGRGGLGRLVLGSVAESVLRRSPCPVLTVGHATAPAAGDGPPFRRIVCAADFEPSFEPTLALALSLAAESGAELTLVHAVEPFFQDVFAAHTHVSVEDYARFLRTQLEARLAEAIPREVLDWCQPRYDVRIGVPAAEIVRAARERGADLIVMGLHDGRGAVDRWLFGSTTQEVLRHAECPVLTPGTRLMATVRRPYTVARTASHT